MKNSKGITLIAVIITIIILLILVGITIIGLLGQEGILGKAELGSKKHFLAQAKEEIELAIVDIKADNPNLSLAELTFAELNQRNGKITNYDENMHSGTYLNQNRMAHFSIDANLAVAVNENALGSDAGEIANNGKSYIPLKISKREPTKDTTTITMVPDLNYTENIKEMIIYEKTEGKDKEIYRGSDLNFEVTVQNNINYQYYAQVIYKENIITLSVLEKGEPWIILLEMLGFKTEDYENKQTALANRTVLDTIKNNEEALKFLSKNKDVFDIVCKNDTTIDDEVIKTGIVPIMTSNTTPAPFVISASSEYQGRQFAWYAFDQTISRMWHTDSIKPVTFQIDMTQNTKISAFSFTSPDRISAMPKNFTLEGSNNGTSWEAIETYTDFSAYTVYETTLFSLENSANYRYYRFHITEDNGYSYVAIYKIQFYE